jgi:MOSC domain-containing protein YiiM
MLRAVDDQPERCTECGFDGARWRVRDAITVLDALGWWWREALADIDPSELARRPAPAVWSVLEYGAHTASVTASLRQAVEGGRDPLRADGDPVVAGPDEVLDDLEREGRDLAAVAHDVRADDADAVALVLHAVHDATHHQMDVGRGLSALGLGAIGGRPGRVAQLNVSSGGVPKGAVDRADVSVDGLAGDRQADRKHHGRPFQAVCLWSTEAIADLTAAGHHVFAGAVGENLTIDGLDWTALRPATRLRVGTSLLELSYPAVPCQKQAQWFTDRDFTHLAYERNPQWTRWYAWVREPGVVARDDDVTFV